MLEDFAYSAVQVPAALPTVPYRVLYVDHNALVHVKLCVCIKLLSDFFRFIFLGGGDKQEKHPR